MLILITLWSIYFYKFINIDKDTEELIPNINIVSKDIDTELFFIFKRSSAFFNNYLFTVFSYRKIS